MDTITIILVIGAVLAGLLILRALIALILFLVGSRKVTKMQKDFFKDDPFDKPFFKDHNRF